MLINYLESCYCSRLLTFFFKIKSFQKILSETLSQFQTRVSNSLDPNQDQFFVGSDLGPNCLHRLLALLADEKRQHFRK